MTAPRVSSRMPVSVAVLAVLCVVTRLPQLLSPNLLVDGDEAVLGLMAKHFVHDHEFPLFFWGQHYGLSTIEAGAAAASFVLFGSGAVPLKVAMLALWTTGVVFVFLALSEIAGRRRAFWMACVFALTPAWAVWSMKARGGYLTAFVAAAVLLWLIARERTRETIARWVAAGALTALVYLAQPLWLTGMLPIVAAMLVSRRRLSWAAAYAAIAATPFGISRLASAGPDAWRGPALGNPGIWGSRIRAAQQIYVHFTGAYYLTGTIDPPGPATTILAVCWCAVLPAVVLTQVYRLATKRYHRWSHLLFAAVASTLVANWVLLFARDGRYLLPLSAPLVALAGIELADLVDRGVLPARVVSAATAVALALGSASMIEFRNFNYLWTNPPNRLSESKRLQQMINALDSRDVHRVFSMNGLLDTQLIFYSDEKIISRWASGTDRHPAYVEEVNRALASGERVAVVGYTNDSGAPGCWDVPICTGGIENLVGNPHAIFTVDGKYFVYVGADRDLLLQLRFELPD